MATEIRKVVKEGWEDIYEIAKTKLENIDADIERKVAEYREKLVAESIDDRARFQRVIDEDCTKEIEIEVPDVVEEENAEMTEEQFIGE
jgi:hypothetical protein